MHDYDAVTTSPPSSKPRTPPRSYDAASGAQAQWRLNNSGGNRVDELADEVGKLKIQGGDIRSSPASKSVGTRGHTRETSVETTASSGSGSVPKNAPEFPTLHDHQAQAAQAQSPVQAQQTHFVRNRQVDQLPFRPQQVRSPQVATAPGQFPYAALTGATPQQQGLYDITTQANQHTPTEATGPPISVNSIRAPQPSEIAAQMQMLQGMIAASAAAGYPMPAFYGQPLADPYAIARAMYPGVAAAAPAPPQTQQTIASPQSPTGSSPIVPGGPSANNRKLGLYKTELCRSWEEKGACRYGTKCQFAHGEEELRQVPRHPKYKTEICRTFWVSGSCPYGKRCCFIHTELPEGKPPGADGKPVPQGPIDVNGRPRSLSINSDLDEQQNNSLLARIGSKKPPTPSQQETPTTPTAPQRKGSLRVDTTTLGSVAKQNKSAYPTFSNRNNMLPTPIDRPGGPASPAPVTAGPDLGRHSLLPIRGEDYRLGRGSHTPVSTSGPSAASNNPNRHSFNGTEALNLSAFGFTSNGRPTSGSSTRSTSSPFAPESSASSASGASNNGNGNGGSNSGHGRTSSGSWQNSALNRNNLLSVNTNSSRGMLASPGATEGMTSPWTATELAVGSGVRRTDRPWI